jgi:hypothetical protein
MLTFVCLCVLWHLLDKNKIYKMNRIYSIKITVSRVAQGKYRLAVWVMQYGPSLTMIAREMLLSDRSLRKFKFQILKSNNFLLQLLDV